MLHFFTICKHFSESKGEGAWPKWPNGIGVTFGGYGGTRTPHFLEWGVPYPPLFRRMAVKVTVTVPEHALKIHYNSFNSRSKRRFSK